MTMYEYYEAWLTTKEWRAWKRHSVTRFSQRYSVPHSEARRERDEYLRQEHDFGGMTRSLINAMFDSMIDDHLYWGDTPQGIDHWQDVSQRRRPIRRLQTLS
jgi:hypothetical protein